MTIAISIYTGIIAFYMAMVARDDLLEFIESRRIYHWWPKK